MNLCCSFRAFISILLENLSPFDTQRTHIAMRFLPHNQIPIRSDRLTNVYIYIYRKLKATWLNALSFWNRETEIYSFHLFSIYVYIYYVFCVYLVGSYFSYFLTQHFGQFKQTTTAFAAGEMCVFYMNQTHTHTPTHTTHMPSSARSMQQRFSSSLCYSKYVSKDRASVYSSMFANRWVRLCGYCLRRNHVQVIVRFN